MRIRLGNAPTSWGIEKPEDSAYPSWNSVLDDVAAAGYEGIELGPYGYLPTDPTPLRTELQARGLSLTAGTVMRPLHLASERAEILALTERTCQLLSEQGASHLVIIEAIIPEREATAGRSEAAPRLSPRELGIQLETIQAVASVARDHGIAPVVHPHAGTYIEFIDELMAIDSAFRGSIGFCIDTGHCAYAGIDPAQVVKSLGTRASYIHLKDIDPERLREARQSGAGFWQAYASGVFCILGQGMVRFEQVFGALADLRYEGWATIEQDAPPGHESRPLEWARASHQFASALVERHDAARRS